MTDQFIRSFEATIDDVVAGERSVVAKINTDAIDRYRTVIMPMGADLEGYRRNPVVLWEHGLDPQRGTMPIGKNQWIKTSERGIVAKTIFRDDAYSTELFRCYQEGWVRGWSVRMVNPKYSAPTRDEIRSRPELSDCENVFRSWEMGEYSGTVLPGNKDTLTMLTSRGIWVPEQTKIALEQIVDSVPALAEAIVRTQSYIEEKDGIWHVRNADGRIVALYHDAEAAERCLLALGSQRPKYVERMRTAMMDMEAATNERIQRAIELVDLKMTGRI